MTDETLTLSAPPPESMIDQRVAAYRDTGPLSVTQVKAGLRAILEVMSDCMKEGQDYGKVPGCGDKPGLFQPGAQKLSMMFQLNPSVAQETVTDYPNFHRGYRLVVRVTAGSKSADGVGECSTLESKYRYRTASKTCPHCDQPTVFRSKDKPEWYCWTKKGGCGNKFADGSPMAKKIEEQSSGKVEHDNPPDFWNTVRKMAFKRGFVHAIINATNTSELWSQDLEDLAANGVINAPESTKERPEQAPATSSRPAQQNASEDKPERSTATVENWRNVRVPFGKNKDKQLGELTDKSLGWYILNADVDKNTPFRQALNAAKAELGETLFEQDEVPF